MSAFADTSGLYAVLDADDDNHDAARDTWADLLERDGRLHTSNYVLVETFALVQHRLGMEAVRAFVGDVGPVLRVEWITPDDHDGATQAVLVAGRRRLSLVDCASFAVMRRLGLEEVFAFDRHFAQQGFRVVPATRGRRSGDGQEPGPSSGT